MKVSFYQLFEEQQSARNRERTRIQDHPREQKHDRDTKTFPHFTCVLYLRRFLLIKAHRNPRLDRQKESGSQRKSAGGAPY